jgi:hypothetical protein
MILSKRWTRAVQERAGIFKKIVFKELGCTIKHVINILLKFQFSDQHYNEINTLPIKEIETYDVRFKSEKIPLVFHFYVIIETSSHFFRM